MFFKDKEMIAENERLKKELAAYQTVQEELREEMLFFELAADGRIRGLNDLCSQALGYKENDVNGKTLDIPSYICSLEDEISLKDKLYDNVLVIKTLESPTLECPHFLSLNKKNKKPVGKVIDTPLLTDVPFEFNEQYFIEFCGNIG